MRATPLLACLLAVVLLPAGGPAATTAPQLRLLIAYERDDDLVDVERARTGASRTESVEGAGGVTAVSFDKGSLVVRRGNALSTIAASGEEGTVRLLTLPQNAARGSWALLSPDRTQVALTKPACDAPRVAAQSIQLFRLRPRIRSLGPVPGVPTNAAVVETMPQAFSNNGRYFVWSSLQGSECRGPYLGKGELHLLDLRTRTDRLLARVQPSAVAFSADDAQIAWVDQAIGVQIRPTRGSATRTIDDGSGYSSGSPATIAWSRTHLIYGLEDEVFSYELATGRKRLLGRVPPPQDADPVATIAGVSPDGRHVAFANAYDARRVFVAAVTGGERRAYYLPTSSRGDRTVVAVWAAFG